jgi:mannonate dehydratase
MRVAIGQFRELNREDLAFAKQIGASGVTYNSIDFATSTARRALGMPDWGDETEGVWGYEALSRLREIVGGHGLKLEALENVPRRMMHNLKLGGPDRQREVDNYCRTVENMGRAGIPILGYNFKLLPVQRTRTDEPGRGGARCTAFDLAAARSETMALGARVTADEVWERYEYFIRRVLPVAESAGVRLALHPDDPPLAELYGVAGIFGTLDGFRRAVEEIAPSPNHGLDFCCGTWSESGVDKMLAAMRHFGARGKIFYVHFRNVKGALPAFVESFIDEGEFDDAAVIALLHELGFDGFLIDDHVPHMVGDSGWAHRGRAYSTGYIRGLVKAITRAQPAPAAVN